MHEAALDRDVEVADGKFDTVEGALDVVGEPRRMLEDRVHRGGRPPQAAGHHPAGDLGETVGEDAQGHHGDPVERDGRRVGDYRAEAAEVRRGEVRRGHRPQHGVLLGGRPSA